MAKVEAKSKGVVGRNGVTEHKVLVTRGLYRGHVLTFTQLSADQYTVFGFSALPTCGISIERRKYENQVMMSHNSAIRRLRDEDQWIAYDYRHDSYYGALAVGATAEEAYRKALSPFSS